MVSARAGSNLGRLSGADVKRAVFVTDVDPQDALDGPLSAEFLPPYLQFRMIERAIPIDAGEQAPPRWRKIEVGA